MRWGLGPVFFYDCLTGARRWQTYAIRSFGVAALLLAIVSMAMPRQTMSPTQGWREYAALGESFFYAIIGVEIAMVMLAAPASTAGAICVDRARGTLSHMLATDLSDPEIVLGKLAARMLPILGLVACSWPVLAICSLLGGIDPQALTLAFAVILAVALLGCSMALALSVWARKPHEVVLVVYSFWMLALLLWPIWYGLRAITATVSAAPDWSLLANPYYVAFAPYSVPGKLALADYAGFFAATVGASAVLAMLAVGRMRPVARRGIDVGRRSRGIGAGLVARVLRALPGPSLDGNPVFWREWHRTRASRWLLILIVLIGGSTSLACFYSALIVWDLGLGAGFGPARMEVIVGIFGLLIQLVFGGLMLAAVAPTSMAEERQRGSLDLLTATPLSTATIVIGKWLGAARLVFPMAIAPGVFAFALAAAHKPPITPAAGMPAAFYAEVPLGERLLAAGLLVATILIHGALIASVGLAAAVWMARQGRAIAASVGFVVMTGGGWPIFLSAMRTGGPASQGLLSLSPLYSVVGILEMLAQRNRGYRTPFGWIVFWDAECLALSMGLVWLTVRTFDRCLGRIPERPIRISVLADVIRLLAVMLGVGGVFGSVAAWRGVFRWPYFGADLGVILAAMAVAAGLVLAAAMTADSTSREAGDAVDRRSFAGLWWASFRMVPLLTIGPALIVLTLVVAPFPVRIVPKTTPLAGGGTSRIWMDPGSGMVLVDATDAKGVQSIRQATPAEVAAAAKYHVHSDRLVLLALAGLALATILMHGAAAVSLGAASGVAIRRRRRAAAVGAGLAMVPIVVWPIVSLPLNWSGHLALTSTVPALIELVFRMQLRAAATEEFAGWVAYWDAILILFAAVACGLAIRTLDRRAIRATEGGLDHGFHGGHGENTDK